MQVLHEEMQVLHKEMTMGALTTALYSHERHKPGQIQHVSNQEGDVSQTETVIMKDRPSPKTNV